jgi:AAA15 family ATPase/GTPase
MVSKQLRFAHQGSGRESYSFTYNDESSGTLAWLSLVVPSLFSLRYGCTFLIDEIDSSLHPRLTAALVNMFKDSELNKKGAQLVFTSHDVSLLGTLTGGGLTPDEVWFTEKDRDGSTELYSLREFPVRQSDNFERRYLHGRYGALPYIEPHELRQALLEELGSE